MKDVLRGFYIYINSVKLILRRDTGSQGSGKRIQTASYEKIHDPSCGGGRFVGDVHMVTKHSRLSIDYRESRLDTIVYLMAYALVTGYRLHAKTRSCGSFNASDKRLTSRSRRTCPPEPMCKYSHSEAKLVRQHVEEGCPAAFSRHIVRIHRSFPNKASPDWNTSLPPYPLTGIDSHGGLRRNRWSSLLDERGECSYHSMFSQGMSRASKTLAHWDVESVVEASQPFLGTCSGDSL